MGGGGAGEGRVAINSRGLKIFQKLIIAAQLFGTPE